MGKCSQKDAQSIKYRVEQIILAKKFNSSLTPEIADWVHGVGDDFHTKLANVGLVEPRLSTKLNPFIESYIEGRSDLADRTIKKYETLRKRLCEFFDSNKSIQDITIGDAVDFRRWLGKSVSENTVNKHIQICKTVFKYALERELIRKNPFQSLPSSTIANKDRFYHVSVEKAQKVLDACPNSQWRTLFSLARFGGLRCPSEPRELRWKDINWSERKILVHSPKTRKSGKPSRIIPLFAELESVFLETRNLETSDFVLPMLRNEAYNPATHMRRIVEKATGSCWAKVFQNCRSTRQTELQREFPTHVVTSWLGNSTRIALDYYLQVTEEDFVRASDPANNKLRMDTANPKQKAKQHIDAQGRTEQQGIRENPKNADSCGMVLSHAIPEIAVRGLEPPRP